MKKRLSVILTLLVLVFVVTACGNYGDISHVEIDFDSFKNSERYSEAEMKTAVDVVLEWFKVNYNDCELSRVWYDERYCDHHSEPYIEKGMTKENVIVFLSDFYVNADFYGGFEPDSNYGNWNWILTRSNAGEDWVLVNKGY